METQYISTEVDSERVHPESKLLCLAKQASHPVCVMKDCVLLVLYLNILGFYFMPLDYINGKRTQKL